MIPSTLKELARITALEELVDTANRLLHEQGCELETAQTRISELKTENARLRALLNAQDEYAYEDNGYVRLDTREDFHKVIGDGD